MPSAFSHPAVPLSIALACGSRYVSPRLLVAGVVASVLPDLDSIGLEFGIPYGDTFGHRGFFHSLAFALVLAGIVACQHRRLCASTSTAFAFILISAASHGLLDTFTDGGLGVALFSPFSNHRYFAPWRPIAVSPLGVADFFSKWGLHVLRSEVFWVWLPFGAPALIGYFVRRRPQQP